MSERNMLGKGLDVLSHLVDHPDRPMGVSEVARAVGVPVSTAHRLLATLVRQGWVARTEQGSGYRLGSYVLKAADSVHEAFGFNDIHAVLLNLSDKVRETALLGTLIGGEFIYLDLVHGPGELSVRGSMGQRGPLHATAIGKALLAGLPTVRRNELIDSLDYEKFTRNTIGDAAALRSEVEQVSSRGYSISSDEYEEGVTSIGIGVELDHDPGGHYAICVAAPTQRTAGKTVNRFHDALVTAKKHLKVAGVSPR